MDFKTTFVNEIVTRSSGPRERALGLITSSQRELIVSNAIQTLKEFGLFADQHLPEESAMDDTCCMCNESTSQSPTISYPTYVNPGPSIPLLKQYIPIPAAHVRNNTQPLSCARYLPPYASSTSSASIPYPPPNTKTATSDQCACSCRGQCSCTYLAYHACAKCDHAAGSNGDGISSYIPPQKTTRKRNDTLYLYVPSTLECTGEPLLSVKPAPIIEPCECRKVTINSEMPNSVSSGNHARMPHDDSIQTYPWKSRQEENGSSKLIKKKTVRFIVPDDSVCSSHESINYRRAPSEINQHGCGVRNCEGCRLPPHLSVEVKQPVLLRSAQRGTTSTNHSQKQPPQPDKRSNHAMSSSHPLKSSIATAVSSKGMPSAISRVTSTKMKTKTQPKTPPNLPPRSAASSASVVSSSLEHVISIPTAQSSLSSTSVPTPSSATTQESSETMTSSSIKAPHSPSSQPLKQDDHQHHHHHHQQQQQQQHASSIELS